MYEIEANFALIPEHPGQTPSTRDSKGSRVTVPVGPIGCFYHILRIFPIIFLALLVVVKCGRRPTDPKNTLAALAAAEQRRQQLHSTREDRSSELTLHLEL